MYSFQFDDLKIHKFHTDLQKVYYEIFNLLKYPEGLNLSKKHDRRNFQNIFHCPYFKIFLENIIVWTILYIDK